MFALTDDVKFDKNTLNFPSNPLLFNSALNAAYSRTASSEQDPDTLNKLCSNFNVQQILYHQHLQNLQKHALQYPLQNGNLSLLNSNNDQEIRNSQTYLMNNFLTNQDKQIINNNFTGNHHPNDDDEDANGRCNYFCLIGLMLGYKCMV